MFSHSVMSDSTTPWTVAHQPSLSMGFPRQEYWSGSPFPTPGDLPDPGIEPESPESRLILYCWATREALGLCQWFSSGGHFVLTGTSRGYLPIFGDVFHCHNLVRGWGGVCCWRPVDRGRTRMLLNILSMKAQDSCSRQELSSPKCQPCWEILGYRRADSAQHMAVTVTLSVANT